jgi:DNA-binding MarR family transcriptional regulator
LLERSNIGFLLAKAAQRWNERLYEKFSAAGYPEVRPSYGALLVPLYEEDGLRIGELGTRARLSKQSMTTMIRLLEKAELIEKRPDPKDARAFRIYLTSKANKFRPIAEAALNELELKASEIEDKPALEAVRQWLKNYSEI